MNEPRRQAVRKDWPAYVFAALLLLGCTETKPPTLRGRWEGTAPATATRPAKSVTLQMLDAEGGYFFGGNAADPDPSEWISFELVGSESNGTVTFSIFDVVAGHQTWVYSGKINDKWDIITGSFSSGPLASVSLPLHRQP